jgi:hypothetical protein
VTITPRENLRGVIQRLRRPAVGLPPPPTSRIGESGAQSRRATGRRRRRQAATPPYRRPSHCRCQRTAVPGRTTISAVRQAWASSIQNNRSRWRSGGRGCVEHRRLLAEREVLKRDCAVSPADQCERSEHDDERRQHERSGGATTAESTGLVGDLILANHRTARRGVSRWTFAW